MSAAKVPVILRKKPVQEVKKPSIFRLSQTAWFVPIFVICLTLLIFRRLILGRVIANGDLATYFYPYWVEVTRLVRSGHLPLWNPYLFTGVPLLANSQIGVFYPLNWPFWLLASDALSNTASALHFSVVLHICLALLNMYFLGRTMGLNRWAAALAGLTFAGGGFSGIHVEHLNQLQAIAWMPLVMLPGDRNTAKWNLPRPISLVAFTMILLTGHTQMTFITGVALFIRELYELIVSCFPQKKQDKATIQPRRIPSDFLGAMALRVRFLASFGLSGLIAAVQLLPTLELSSLSTRQAGLNWREAVSFSLEPWRMAGTFLPPYITPPVFPESVAYVGVVGLGLLGCGLWFVLRQKQKTFFPIILLMISGILLAFGGYNPLYLLGVRMGIPGLIHFRAPVRFLALYTLAASLLVGKGFVFLQSRIFPGNAASFNHYKSLLAILLLVLLCGELLISAEWLPHSNATISRAYTDMRPATAHLVSVTEEDKSSGKVPGRFLSISRMLFEVGDKAEIESIYNTILSEDALWAFLVSEKQREILTPNLPLTFHVPAADGYDGGLLPLSTYFTFSNLLLPDGTQDGRLRENLVKFPDNRWLRLMDVRYLITDKQTDTWIDDILYDRQFQVVLPIGEEFTIGWLPEGYKADGIGLLYTGEGGRLIVEFDGYRAVTSQLPELRQPKPYRLHWEENAIVENITLSASTGVLTPTAISLINEVTGSFYPLTLSDKYKLSHSGDVKIYEDLYPSTHFFFVADCQVVTTDSQALYLMAEPTFDPFDLIILDDAAAAECQGGIQHVLSGEDNQDMLINVLEYGAADIKLEFNALKDGFIVISDAWYPGWHGQLTSIDIEQAPQPVPVLRGDLLFRAVPVPSGHWHLDLHYTSTLFLNGLVVSGIGIILFSLVLYIYRKV